jgi:hypothetical protein
MMKVTYLAGWHCTACTTVQSRLITFENLDASYGGEEVYICLYCLKKAVEMLEEGQAKGGVI